MRCLLLFLCLCQTASAQSIVFSSDGRSAVVSGKSEVPVASVPSKETTEFVEVKPQPQPQVQPSSPPAPVPPQPAAAEVVQVSVVEDFLVSEPYCSACPPAKSRFLARGGKKENIINVATAKARFGKNISRIPFEFSATVVQTQTQVRHTAEQAVGVPSCNCSSACTCGCQAGRRCSCGWAQTTSSSAVSSPIVDTQWGRINLDTYNRPGCNCPMCQGIRHLQQQRQYQTMSIKRQPAQEPTPEDTVALMIPLLKLTSRDVLIDLGCGDGRILIEAVKQSGCWAIGIEIDPVMAEAARKAVLDNRLSDKIEIRVGDARTADLTEATAITAYLYPELLEKLSQRIKESPARVVASPYHEIPGLGQSLVGDIWIYRRDK